MTNQNRGKAVETIRVRTLPIISNKTEFTVQKAQESPFRRANALSLFAFLLTLLLMITMDRPAGAAELPAVMHSPQGALDVAAALPGKYGLLATKGKPIGPGEATVSSVKAIAGLMKQAVDVAALLPETQAAKPLPKAEVILMRPADAALSVASFVPKALPKKAAVRASELLRSSALLWPTDGLIYSTFGATRGKRGHGAIDIVTKKGAPIAAAAAGKVVVAANGGKLFSGYGKIVILDHGEGIHTVYAHCDSILVKIGQQVNVGEFVGTVGRTGRATTDHCHFEVRVAGKKVDPMKYLPSRPEMVKATNWRSSPAKKKAN